MGNKLTDEAREELREAVEIVRSDRVWKMISERTKTTDPSADPKDPKLPADPKDPKTPPAKDPADPPAEPKRVGLWPVGNTDDD